MKTGLSTNRHHLQSTVLLTLLTCLTSCTGFRLSTDPLDDAILQGFDRAGDDALMVKKGDPEVAGMWFGPRLGRRDRRSADEMLDDVADDRVGETLEFLKEAGWTLVPVRGGKRQTGGFIPRLGRDSNEDDDSDSMKQRSPPFAPRLGRRLVPYRPRTGRDRSPHDVYSPRLGRSIHPLQPHENKQSPQH